MTSYTISDVELSPLNLPLTETFSIATGHQEEVRNVLIKVRLANGVTGLGEAAPFPAVNGETQESTLAAIYRLESRLIGKDIRTWKSISDSIAADLHHAPSALCAIQMALADAVAKCYGIPLSVMFGGSTTTLRTDMTVTASDIPHAEQSARAIVARGIGTIKIKTAGKDIDLDFKRIKTIRETAPQADLTIDGNCGYTLKGALQLIDMLQEADIPLLFFEQPLPREQWREMAILAKESGIKLAADESARSAADVLRIAEERSAHVINIKLMKAGLFEAMRMAEIAKAAGIELMIGGMVETILAMSFSAHFATGIGGFKYADLDTPLFIPSHPFTGGFELNGDIIKISHESAGHGVELKQ